MSSMWSEVAAIYRASKKKKDINWWTEWVCRPPAAVVVYLLKNTRVTPNQVTFLSVVVAAISAALFVFWPTYWGALVAAIVYEFSFVLDCADGQLARLRKKASPLGHLLDFLMDEIKAMLLLACISIRLWQTEVDQVYLICGCLGVFALASSLTLTSFTRRQEYGAPPPTEDGQPAVIAQRKSLVGRFISLFEHAGRVVVHYPSYIWLVAAVGHMEIYFWAYTVVCTLYLGKVSLSILLKLGRFEPAP